VTGRDRRFGARDIVAGVSVALLLIPQAVAYAELAGLSGRHGLYAAVVGPIAAAFFASSPFLQTGPGALTALLTFGALAPLAVPGGTEYALLAALLALVVGVARVVVGWIRAGWLSYLLSRPMLEGFTSAAALLILLSQTPDAFGVAGQRTGVVESALAALLHPSGWNGEAVVVCVLTVALIRGARLVHPLVPGVVIATAGGLLYSMATGYAGPTVGALDAGLPVPALALPWGRFPEIFIPAVVIALVGFSEAASISRFYSTKERVRWSPSREFVSQGAANLASGLFSGMPVGGSFARSSVAYLAGGQSRWTGLVAGLVVLAFLPFADLLSLLPRAVLAGIIIASIAGLIELRMLMRLWTFAKPQALVGWSTFGVTLLLSPRIDQGVMFGLAAGLAVHLWRELRPGVMVSEVVGDTIHVRPEGVLWFGSEAHLERELLDRLAANREVNRVVFHLDRLGRIDATGALLLEEFVEEAEKVDVQVKFVNVPDHARRVVDHVLEVDPQEFSGPEDLGRAARDAERNE